MWLARNWGARKGVCDSASRVSVLPLCASKKLLRIGGTEPEERARGGEASVGYLGMQGHGCPGGFRLVGVGVELVGFGVEPPDEEEAGDGGGEEDEDHPQRAHL